MNHPQNSPDMAPSDYHMFPNLKKHLHTQRFSTDDELNHAMEQWLKGQSELFYFTETEKLCDRYQMWIDKDGEYFEEKKTNVCSLV